MYKLRTTCGDNDAEIRYEVSPGFRVKVIELWNLTYKIPITMTPEVERRCRELIEQK